jgi:hypothetical protein
MIDIIEKKLAELVEGGFLPVSLHLSPKDYSNFHKEICTLSNNMYLPTEIVSGYYFSHGKLEIKRSRGGSFIQYRDKEVVKHVEIQFIYFEEIDNIFKKELKHIKAKYSL